MSVADDAMHLSSVFRSIVDSQSDMGSVLTTCGANNECVTILLAFHVRDAGLLQDCYRLAVEEVKQLIVLHFRPFFKRKLTVEMGPYDFAGIYFYIDARKATDSIIITKIPVIINAMKTLAMKYGF